MGWPPWANIERTDRMLVYGPSKPSSQLSTEAWLFSTTLLAVVGEKLRTDPWIGWLSCCGLGAPFLRDSGCIQIYWWLHERLLYVDHVRYVWSRAILRPSVESVWRVGRVFPYRVYIDSDHRDSRIWVPLICDSHYIDNLNELSLM
jgi:hypothetical protein